MAAVNVMQKYYEKEAVVFREIPGMAELLKADAATAEKISLAYPDAAFALQIANSLFHHNREISLINQRAYFAILEGEPISSVQYKYDKDVTAYLKKHCWDD